MRSGRLVSIWVSAVSFTPLWPVLSLVSSSSGVLLHAGHRWLLVLELVLVLHTPSALTSLMDLPSWPSLGLQILPHCRMDKIEMRDLWKPLKFLGSKIRVFISLILLLPFHLSGLRCQDCYGWVKYLTACS